MINFLDHMFDHHTSKSDKVIIVIFSIISGLFSPNFLFWFSLENLVKAMMSMAGIAIGGVVTKITLTAYERYLKDKIFKPRKNEKEETEKRA